MTYSPPPAPAPVAAPPPPAKKFPWLPVIIGVVVVCVLCSGIALVAGIGKWFLDRQGLPGGTISETRVVTVEVLTVTPEAQPVEPSETAQPPATETPSASPTATATLAPTEVPATPTPADTATPEAVVVTPETVTGLVREEGLLQDDFSSDAAGWPSASDTHIELRVQDGTYYFQILTPDIYDWAYLPVDFIPQQVSFDVINIQEPFDGTYGLFCQYQDRDNYLFVEVTSPEGYLVGQRLNGEARLLESDGDPGYDWTFTDALKNGLGEVNHFQVICKPDEVTLYINGQFIHSARVEQPFAAPGRAALMVYAIKEADEDGFAVEFDNVTVRAEPLE